MKGHAPNPCIVQLFQPMVQKDDIGSRNSDSSDMIHLGTLYSKRVLMASCTSLLRPDLTFVPYRIPMPKPWLRPVF